MEVRRQRTSKPRPRKRVPAAPNVQSELAQRILAAVPAGICQVSLNGALCFANSVAVDFLGLSYDELSKMYIADFENKVVYEDGRECPVADYPVARCLATGQAQAATILGVQRPDGRVCWGIFTALPVDDDHGKLTGAVVTFIDITPRKHAEQAVRESEERYRQLVEFCPDGILIHADGKIVFANQAVTDIFGAKNFNDLRGLPVMQFVHPNFHDTVRARIRRLNDGASEQPWHEVTIVRLDGSLVEVEAASQTVVLKGQRSVQVMIRDITERKRADKERDQLFAQVEAARGRLELLSRRLVEVQEAERRHVARELHDHIGQELTALKLNLDRYATAPADAPPNIIEEARCRVDHLVKLVREMSLDLRPTMLDDLGLVPALHWHFDRFFGTSGIRVNFKHTGLGTRRFDSDLETAAYRVVQEALTNVVRHSGAKEAMVRLWAGENSLCVQVEDLGVGFDPEKALASGRSSGLSGLRERAALLGGQLRIESTLGSGTHLTAEFPVNSKSN
jgi:PAS domain S-box-containing protein